MNTANLIDRRNSIDAAIVMISTVSNACRNVCRKSTVDAIDALVRELSDERAEIAGEIERRAHRFDDVAILQARISYGGRSAKIACAKPNEKCDEPSVTEAAYNAVLRRLGVPNGERPTSAETFPIAVLDRAGWTVAIIEPKAKNPALFEPDAQKVEM